MLTSLFAFLLICIRLCVPKETCQIQVDSRQLKSQGDLIHREIFSTLGVIAFRKLQNVSVAKALMSSYIFQVYHPSCSYSLAELIVLCSFNVQNWYIRSSLRNLIVYANEANIVNKDFPITSTRMTLIRDLFSYDFPQMTDVVPYGSYDNTIVLKGVGDLFLLSFIHVFPNI